MTKIAVITGASQGIGECLAENLASKNYKLILCARNLTLLENLKKRLEATYKVTAECFKEGRVFKQHFLRTV